MIPNALIAQRFQLPKIRSTIKGGLSAYWDVKFYPYSTSIESPPIFAVVHAHAVYLCQADADETSGVIFLATYMTERNHREDVDSLNSCTWCYVNHQDPLIAVAGESGHIQVLFAGTGLLFTTLVGHGLGTVNDLATHPLYPWIVASASMDSSVRIWDLRRAQQETESNCIIICGHSSAHREGLLTIGWHEHGRYLITGGFDHKVCVWIIPDLSPESTFWQEISSEKRKRSSDEVRVIHYPHFVSSAIHSDYVDKAVFFGDLIISKAAGKEDKIVLWGITGFSSDREPPPPDAAPKTNDFLDTRSGFVRLARTSPDDNSCEVIDLQYSGLPLYERHLEFHNPFCQSFYTRFGLLQPTTLYPDVHPILTMGNNGSQIRHWDLERLIIGHDGGVNDGVVSNNSARKPSKLAHKKGLARVKSKDRFSSAGLTQSSARETNSPPSSRASSSAFAQSDVYVREPSTEATSLASEQLPRPSVGEQPAPDRRKYPLNDPYRHLKEHKMNDVTDFKSKETYLTARAVDWSPCGSWCVVVGESSNTAVMIMLDRQIATT